MVSLKGREQGLIHIAVVDFFSGKIVLRSIVDPGDGVTDWRKAFTGLNKVMLRTQKRKPRKVLRGWEEAREHIFEVATRDTIFMGHALANDLRILRIATDRVIDSMTMMSLAVFGDAKKFPRNWSLKTACKELLDVEVQKTRGPHVALEDALATRELVLQFVRNPEKLAEWGAAIRANLEKMEQAEKAKEEKKMEKRRLRREAKALKTPEQRAFEKADRAGRRAERLRAEAAEKEMKKRKVTESKSKTGAEMAEMAAKSKSARKS
ncbi:ribonuclease H-like domain-containing protein [Nemania sp. NC0429]|nr:ribonuclease H-like domain-containing protein [Nemania sp. NC0429]